MQPAVPQRPPHKSSAFDGVTGYHWLVFFCAAAGWLFDCMGKEFRARRERHAELLGSLATDAT